MLRGNNIGVGRNQELVEGCLYREELRSVQNLFPPVSIGALLVIRLGWENSDTTARKASNGGKGRIGPEKYVYSMYICRTHVMGLIFD
jgi:hypothetical protein